MHETLSNVLKTFFLKLSQVWGRGLPALLIRVLHCNRQRPASATATADADSAAIIDDDDDDDDDAQMQFLGSGGRRIMSLITTSNRDGALCTGSREERVKNGLFRVLEWDTEI